jgi:hypothetical protein
MRPLVRRTLDVYLAARRRLPGPLRIIADRTFELVSRSRVLDVLPASDSSPDRTGILWTTRTWVSEPPRMIDGTSLERKPPPSRVTDGSKEDDCAFRVLSDARVTAATTSWIQGRNQYVPDGTWPFRDEIRINGPSVRFQGRGAIIHDPWPNSHRVPSGVFLGGRGCSNWYHLVMEILPRLLLRDGLPSELRTVPLLVPRSLIEVPAAEELIAALAPDATIIELPSDTDVTVDQLVWIDVPMRSAYKLERYVTIRPDHESLDPEFYAHYREILRERLGVDPTGTPPRVFLDRGTADARPYNREAVLELVSSFDFEIVEPGALSAKEQFSLFAGAEHVIGPHGAAWAGVLWGRTGGRGLALTADSRRVSGFSGFQNLAAVSGFSLQDIRMSQAGDGWVVDVSRLRTVVDTFLRPAAL